LLCFQIQLVPLQRGSELAATAKEEDIMTDKSLAPWLQVGRTADGGWIPTSPGGMSAVGLYKLNAVDP
jgi:hypothetical protein